MAKKEMVDHPGHYQSAAGIEVIEVIEAFGLGFNDGNAVKYILRARMKGKRIEDIKKALWYLERELATLQHREARES
jgi:NADH:ubiquinone oxidoreductase subunit F (NADH-binding)